MVGTRFIALGISAFLGVLLMATPASANHAGYCYAGDSVTHGTAGNDTHNLVMDECYDSKDGNDIVNAPTFGDVFSLMGPGADQYFGTDSFSVIYGAGGVDVLKGHGDYDILYGGDGADGVYGMDGPDDLFGGPFCKETGHWGFYQSGTNEEAAPNGCVYEGGSSDGADTISGGAGNDYIWESNSDNGSDDQPDYIDGGAGSDHCMVGTEDTVVNCEYVSTLT